MSSTPNLRTAAWRKSTYSNGGDGNCVEVSDSFPSLVPVRDSKDLDREPLTFANTTWSTFVSDLKHHTI
ncbi:DUF397 domain-containing protein [Streptomyces sp. AJS327]|uniref:DUF397 domain-containing protein n=1 Tax=Streptomyces sp. AJS327 TaxID=2545265 RepID=UPI0015DF3960|nr:DUF397 domain-containing protein [Streptomyces sp. AJS327]MBA0049621.1 DUF397 domain-containing protein [Streptomyces sp. AJS327]